MTHVLIVKFSSSVVSPLENSVGMYSKKKKRQSIYGGVCEHHYPKGEYLMDFALNNDINILVQICDFFGMVEALLRLTDQA